MYVYIREQYNKLSNTWTVKAQNLKTKSAAMKRILSSIFIALLFTLVSNAMDPVATGKTNCCLGNYVIEKASNPILVDGTILETFVISYENSDAIVTVGVDKSNKKCTTYIVQSDNLSMQYDCNRKYFGVKKVDKKYSKDGYSSSDETINRSEYFNQRIITRLEKTELDHIKLISVYFPKLVTDYEEVFAVK